MSTYKIRSPNYPMMDLGESIEAVRNVYAKERRAKFPRQSLAGHLGYSSLNGRALSKIGALRAYGLIEGREDALQVSSTAMAILEAPKDSDDYVRSMHEAFNSPPLFVRIAQEHGGENPSDQTLRWWLAKHGYVGDAADKALKVYLSSAALVNSIGLQYISMDRGPVEASHSALEIQSTVHKHIAEAVGTASGSSTASGVGESIAMGAQERILQSGMLSKTANYRVIVSGHVGEAEIDRLLRKLEMDKEILADADPDEGPNDEDRDPFA